ncbi:GSCOCG00008529001-RA-CDS [Cotesia congregata]|nr:GSCOCG00008529001-RA-CDS [Cotesia congregata]
MSDVNQEEKSNKKNWTDEERLDLATKLDNELDEYINSFEKKPYSEGWPEDRWQEEMEKHPFFMKQFPENGEVSPLMEGLQQLKYSEEENSPEELAINYKEDGNFNFKYKKYRLAILSYTEGIKTQCKDDNIRAQLYNNRAAAHFMLKNYRLNDSKQAMKFQQNYPKALSRAASCSYYIKNYDQCIEFCNKHIAENGPSAEISRLMTSAISEQKQKNRMERLKDKREEKEKRESEKLLETIKSRNLIIDSNGQKNFETKHLDPQIPQLADHTVRLDADGKLIWPVVILYPEIFQSDFIQNFHEDTRFVDQLEEVLSEPPEWDTGRRYNLASVNVYLEADNKVIHKVDISQTLGSILKIKGYIIKAGTPSFFILIANSDSEKKFLDNYKS